jgi:PAS domain S-box-containing protein
VNMKRLFSTPAFCTILLALVMAGPASGGDRLKLIVGGDHDNPPYEFLENGKPTGFNIELMRAVAEATGMDAEFRLGPWGEVRQKLEQGKIDALAGMYYSPQRSQLLDFSVPHTMVSAGLFVRKDSPIRSLEDIKGKEVIVQESDVIHDYLRENGVTSHIVAVTNPEDELRLLASGRHDCALMPSRFQGEYLKRMLGLSELRVISADLPQLHYCFAVRKGNKALLYRLDEGLNILKVNGRYREIYEKWFGVYEKKDLWQTLRYFVWALAVIAALLAASFIWSWFLRREVRKRTAELRESEEKFRVLTETSPSGIWLYQGERIVYVNPAAARILEYTEEECLGMSFWNWVHEDFREMVRERGLARQRGEPVPSQYECKQVTKSGKEKWALISAGMIEYRGKPAGIVTMFDISERKRMEEDLQHAFDDLEKRVQERTLDLRNANELLQHEVNERNRAEEVLRESETAVRRKLESILDPEGDTGELDLADIIDAPETQALMDDLYRLAGLKMSIIDLKGRVLVDVGWQDICSKFHRAHPETREKCYESDTDLTVGVSPGEFRTYRCRNNMWHLVTPIMVGGRHMGNLFMGQFFFDNEQLDYDLFRSQASRYGFPEEEYIASLEAVPRHSKEWVNMGKAVFLRLTDMFSKLSYANIKLARSLTERDRLTETLRESEARLKLAMDLAKLGAWEYDISTGLFSFDDQFYALYGTTAEQEGGTLMSAEVYARKFIPPEESAIVANGIAEVQANSYMQLEHRIIRADGMERFIVVRAEAVFDQQGSFVKIRGANQDITERKRAEEELRESRAKYQAIVDNFEGLIYICSQDYRVEFMNRKLIERTGYDATGEFCYKVMHDRDSVCPWCVNDRVFAGETIHWEMFSPKDNRWFYVVNVPIPHADGTMSKQSMILDITDRKLAEEDLRKANMVVENSPVVLFRCKATPGWPVELVSNNVIQFGYTPEEFLSGELTYSSIVYPRDLAKLIAETEEYSATGKGKWLQEYRIVTKEGDLRWISDETVCERNEEGEITYYEGVIIDVTERRKAEEQLILQQVQLRELNSTLEKRVQEEVTKNREKDMILIQQNRQAALGEILDHIAHQWKQPLNILNLIMYELEYTHSKGELTEEQIKKTVDKVTALTENMSQTIDVFRDFYRPDKEKTVFSVKESIDKALSFIVPALRFNSIEVELVVEQELSAIGYPKEYAQVFLNIMANARDALKERGAVKPLIKIRAFADADKAIVDITDNAGGIPDKFLERIFDIYFTTKESSGGTGIGLYMSKNIIEKNMGGTLSVCNVEQGAQFRIALDSPVSN